MLFFLLKIYKTIARSEIKKINLVKQQRVNHTTADVDQMLHNAFPPSTTLAQL